MLFQFLTFVNDGFSVFIVNVNITFDNSSIIQVTKTLDFVTNGQFVAWAYESA